MQKIRSALFIAAACLGILPSPGPTQPSAPPADSVAFDFVEGLTTEVGPRKAGTPDEARGRAWAVEKLKSLGFANVRIEDYRMPVWERGAEEAHVVSPFPQRLVLTGLGNSGSTGEAGVQAEIAYFPSLAALQAAPDGSLRGKIAFVSHAMAATQDGSSYGSFGAVRRQGPSIASRKGAIAILIRSIGTDHHRTPHTGVQTWAPGASPIPAAALSVPDAELLEHMVARGKPVVVHLKLVSHMVQDQPSGNVVAEVPGSDPKAGIIVAACHLDSWDLGTGAIDNAAGCGIIAAAAKKVMATGEPRRTIRLLLAGAEEVGGFGGKAYFKAHAGDPHVLAMESDFGADRVWQVAFKLPPKHDALQKRITDALSPLGIGPGGGDVEGGEDVSSLVEAGVPVIDLRQDGTRYFDIHHTADDTMDKVDPAQLQQNVDAWATVLSITANAEEPLR